jgi:small subunit ribosomal protein S1
MVGQWIDVRILSCSRRRRDIVVSRRVVLEEQAAQARRDLCARFKPGDVVEGTVKTVKDFGVFVDIGGLDALANKHDLSWEEVSDLSKVWKAGDRIKVKVLKVAREKGRVVVGIKQTLADPWAAVELRYPAGTRVQGQVIRLEGQGAFVEIEKGIGGMIFNRELSWSGMVHRASHALKVGDTVEAVVLERTCKSRLFPLSLRQARPDPWARIHELYSIGQKVEVFLWWLEDMLVGVHVTDGIDGIILREDFSWVRKVNLRDGALKKGQKLDAIVLEIDEMKRRLRLGVKQVSEDPFLAAGRDFHEGDVVIARIIDLPSHGAVVVMPNGIEAFVPREGLIRDGTGVDENYQIGEELRLRIVRINVHRRSVILSEWAAMGIAPNGDKRGMQEVEVES